MTRYFFVILIMGLIGVAIVVKAGITMFAERQYWQDVADRFVKENVTVKPNRGNIISSDGKLMVSWNATATELTEEAMELIWEMLPMPNAARLTCSVSSRGFA